jgi:hypothetical protein
MNRSLRCRPLVLAAMLAAAAPAAAGTFSWFDRSPLALNPQVWSPRYAAFEVDLYRSPDLEPLEENSLRMTGRFERDLLAPSAARLVEDGIEGAPAPRLRTFGIAWQHRLDTTSHVTFSADYHHDAARFLGTSEIADTRASVSLTNRWRGEYGPRLTGSLFVGGERGASEAYSQLGRRYYGLSLGGELTVFGTHTPYISFQMQRGIAAGGDETLLSGLYDDDRSQIAAGWKWRAKPYLSLQAEASYGSSSNRFQLQNPEHSRVFFGTRFDFK